MLTPEQDTILQAWQAAKLSLEAAKQTEMDLRLQVQTFFGEDLKGGTNKLDLGNGWTLKLVAPTQYSLAGDRFALAALVDKIKTMSNEPIAEDLFKWKVELSVTNYKKLDAANPVHTEIAKEINAILTTKLGSPQLEIVPPKN